MVVVHTGVEPAGGRIVGSAIRVRLVSEEQCGLDTVSAKRQPPNPLGPPNSNCTGGVIAGSWAHFTFPPFTLPTSATVVGILLRVKYKSPSGSNTVQLTDGGTLVGSSTSIASVSGSSGCAGTTFTSVGSDTDMWGSTLSAADVAAGAVGVRLTQNANTVDIDAVELTVYSTS